MYARRALVFFLGLSAIETASVLGLQAGAVRTATHRAVGRLREVLGHDVMMVEGDADVS